MNPNVFREYDVRGVVGDDLNEEFVFNLGRSIGTYAAGFKIKKNDNRSGLPFKL